MKYHKYYIYVNGKEISEVSGIEAAYEAWCLACGLADYICTIAELVDGETGEVLESNNWNEEELEEDFDPYEDARTLYC